MSFSEWKTYTLEESLDALIDYRGKTPNKTSSGIPLITAKIVKDGTITTPTEFIAVEDYDNWMTRGLPEVGDVVLTTEAPLGEVAQIQDKKVALAQRIVTLRGKEGLLDSTYLKYYLLSDIGQKKLKERETGTTVTGIKQSELRKVEVMCPPIKYQKRVASILSSLDDKIELNRETNETLEAIAQALFKEWFVNFNYPGATGEMVESELGMIPKGWKVGKLQEVCELAYGKALKAETRIKGEFPVVGSSGIVDSHNEYFVKGPGIVIGRKGTIGEVTWLHSDFYPIDTTFYIVDKIGVDDLYYHYFLLKKQDFRKISSDSAVPGLNRIEAYGNPVIIPLKGTVVQFNNLMKSIFEQVNNIDQQSEALTMLRDCILPRLMNGQININ